jgi:hypothetical protein
MIRREPVLISTATAIPGERLTVLFSICMWVRSSDTNDSDQLAGRHGQTDVMQNFRANGGD